MQKQMQVQQQIPFGNDRKKCKDNDNVKCMKWCSAHSSLGAVDL
jgi:hypothetical protein